jgi:predicted DNA-binding transcriptional regulator YafY
LLREVSLRRPQAGDGALLDGPPLPNCRTLADAWREEAGIACSNKTILRDMRWLRDQGAPIAYDDTRKGYYYAEETYALPAVIVRESDLFPVCIAEKSLRQYVKTPLFEKLHTLVQKFCQPLAGQMALNRALVNERISFTAPPARKIDPATWDTIVHAVGASRRITIRYRDDTAARDVDPYHLTNHKGDWYVIGHCHVRGDLRMFAVSRIRRAEATDHAFEIPGHFDPTAYFNKMFGIMRSDKAYKIRILFMPEGAAVAAERQWLDRQALKRNRDGSLLLTGEASHLAEVASWILSWGSIAKALAPRELVVRVRQEHARAARLYR